MVVEHRGGTYESICLITSCKAFLFVGQFLLRQKREGLNLMVQHS